MKRTPLRRVSKRRAKDMKTYSAQRKVFLEEKPSCEVCNGAYSCDVHHKAKRGGSNYLDVTTWLAVCRGCHQKIHAAPAWARANGYLV